MMLTFPGQYTLNLFQSYTRQN